jgi:ectoine hydroxylase-related dioxygenase (phytanoyl-CoA dioxygenase family)
MPASAAHGLTLRRDGAERHVAVLSEAARDSIAKAIAHLPRDRAGSRLYGIAELVPYLSVGGAIGALAGTVLGSRATPVRALLFDKNSTINWSVRWHQDRTIAVRRRTDIDGYGPWSMKAGIAHVTPPFDILAAMLTLRVHLDDVGASNAPLLIAPGSHQLGPVPEAEIGKAAARCGTFACLAEAGDVWLSATPILHASERAQVPTRRRVLQVDYSASDLPAGLDWLGI